MRHFVWFFFIFFYRPNFAKRGLRQGLLRVRNQCRVKKDFTFRSALVRKIKVSRSKLLVAFANCRTTNGDSLELRLCFRNRVQQFHCSDHIYFDATLICLSFF